MDWTSVVSIAITGLVGIAGVVGTIVAAKIASKSATKDLKLSINAESDRARRAEKRQIYAESLAAFTEVSWASFEYLQQTIKEDRDASRVRLKTLLDGILKALGEARLIASPEIVNSLDDAHRVSYKYISEIDKGKDDKILRAIAIEIGDVRGSMEAAMRADLD
jgi:hypothetical protein